MKCEYCGRRVPGRLVIQGIKNCQGCGAKLPYGKQHGYVVYDEITEVDWDVLRRHQTAYQLRKNCQGCGARLPVSNTYNHKEVDDFLRRLQVAEHIRRYNLASEDWIRRNVLSEGELGTTYVAILEEIESRSRTDRV